MHKNSKLTTGGGAPLYSLAHCPKEGWRMIMNTGAGGGSGGLSLIASGELGGSARPQFVVFTTPAKFVVVSGAALMTTHMSVVLWANNESITIIATAGGSNVEVGEVSLSTDGLQLKISTSGNQTSSLEYVKYQYAAFA